MLSLYHCFCSLWAAEFIFSAYVTSFTDLLDTFLSFKLCTPNFEKKTTTEKWTFKIFVQPLCLRAGPNAPLIQPIHKWDIFISNMNRRRVRGNGRISSLSRAGRLASPFLVGMELEVSRPQASCVLCTGGQHVPLHFYSNFVADVYS